MTVEETLIISSMSITPSWRMCLTRSWRMPCWHGRAVCLLTYVSDDGWFCQGYNTPLPVSLATLLRKYAKTDNALKETVKEEMIADAEYWLRRPLTPVCGLMAMLICDWLIGSGDG